MDGRIFYRRATPTWSSWETITTSDVKEYSYENNNIKKGRIYFKKIGRVVQVQCEEDFTNLGSGIVTYINTIAEDIRPLDDVKFSSWNNKSYIFMCVQKSGSVYFGNYSGASISKPTNGAFQGTYLV